MAGAKTQISNFSHLAVHDEQLARLGAFAAPFQYEAEPDLKARILGNSAVQHLRPRGARLASDKP
jgi:hypothetical protein